MSSKTAEELAEWLHDNYEQIATSQDWQTQLATRVPFKDLPTANKRTMLILAERLIKLNQQQSKTECQDDNNDGNCPVCFYGNIPCKKTNVTKVFEIDALVKWLKIIKQSALEQADSLRTEQMNLSEHASRARSAAYQVVLDKIDSLQTTHQHQPEASKTATEIFKAAYLKRTGKEADETVLHHMDYCIQAIHEAQQHQLSEKSEKEVAIDYDKISGDTIEKHGYVYESKIDFSWGEVDTLMDEAMREAVKQAIGNIHQHKHLNNEQ
jgi:hypothetical protein